MRDELMEFHGHSPFARMRIAKGMKLRKLRRTRQRWALVRWAVKIRPYALKLLENHAEVVEEKRIARAVEMKDDPDFDPLAWD